MEILYNELFIYFMLLGSGSFLAALTHSWLKASGFPARVLLLGELFWSIGTSWLCFMLIAKDPSLGIIYYFELTRQMLSVLGLSYVTYITVFQILRLERLLFPFAHVITKVEDSIALQVTLLSQTTVSDIVDRGRGSTLRVLIDPIEFTTPMPTVIPNPDL